MELCIYNYTNGEFEMRKKRSQVHLGALEDINQHRFKYIRSYHE
jgi:hypothetical protein